MQARRLAQQADLVVVNHHLFFADLMLREEGVTDLLPLANTVIFDEAHQLPETASLFFGQTVSTAQLLELARDTLAEGLAVARDLRLALPQETVRLHIRQLAASSPLLPALDAAAKALDELAAGLEEQASRSEGLEQCWRRSQDLARRLRSWAVTDEPQTIRWIEAYSHSLQLHCTPLSVAETFTRARAGQPRAWIFTSATLAVKADFTHFTEQLGLGDATARAWPSPFDYSHQALLYVPRDLPEPMSAGYTEAVCDKALPVIQAAGGRAFVLCTTLRAVQVAAERLRETMAAAGLDFPLLVQGEGSRSELLERFRGFGNAILVGSQSFWEGIDVRGRALSVVVIDKLPFAPPDDPVLAARLDALARMGGNPFMDYQLPSAVIALKQGAGRLIRDETDRGVLILCDPRLISKPYGKRIWQSLPAFRRTREEDEAVRFFDSAVPLDS
jgi:ATP-dependent DNA helicase DinG